MNQDDIYIVGNEMCELVPFPKYDLEERLHNLLNGILGYKYLNLASKMNGWKILNFNCRIGD